MSLDRYHERCEKCGTPLFDNPNLRPARLCPTHLEEARVAAGPFVCSTAAIDAGMGEPLPPEPKGTLTCKELRRDSTCQFCGAPMSPGEWTVRVNGRDAQPQCAGDDGWEIK